MITEDYVSFETAKLLREKGFNKDTYTMSMYDENGEAKDVLLLKVGEEPVLRPTLQMAMKWLREVHEIHISITPLSFEDGIFWMYKIIKLWSNNNCSELHRSDSRVGFNTYEEACEAAIKYCLKNLIYE